MRNINAGYFALSVLNLITFANQGRRPDKVGTCPWLSYFAPLALRGKAATRQSGSVLKSKSGALRQHYCQQTDLSRGSKEFPGIGSSAVNDAGCAERLRTVSE